MSERSRKVRGGRMSSLGIVLAQGESPSFRSGDKIRILVRFPIGHYRVPT
jgi:hypothetical protein